MKLVSIALVVPLAVSAPLLAAPQVQSYQVSVNVKSAGTSYRYNTGALVVRFPRGSQTQIAYIGGKRGFAGTYQGMPELVAANPRGLVMNGGYYTNDPSSPAGLLLVNGRIISPFVTSQSATLCSDKSGTLKLQRTSAIRASAKSIAKMCFDGLQTYPIVVNNGLNDINALELRRPSYRRTLIGLGRDGSVVAVFFRAPVHLYVAAEFLRARQVAGRNVQITGEAGRRINATGGLGLVDVVNLSGDTDSFVALNGKVLVGDIYRQLPSAIVIK